MRNVKIALLSAILTSGLACGYSAKQSSTPPAAGTMPSVAQLAPANTNSGAASFILTVNGANFNGNATINWNATPQTTQFVSSSQLTATIAATDVATAGTAAVTVTNPGTSGGIYGGGTLPETSNSMTFTIN